MSTGRDVVVAVPGLSGGVDEAVRHLFGSADMRRHWRITVLTTKGKRPRLAPFVFAGALVRLGLLRARGQVDLLHLNVSFKGSTLRKCIVALVARALRIPYVVQVHSGGYEDFYRGLPPVVARAVRGLFINASHVCVLGLPFRDLIAGPIGVPADRISIVRNAVDLPAAPVGIEPAGTGRASDGRPPIILFTGRLWARKGVYDLLEALAAIADLDWEAVLVGDGEVDDVAARVEAIGLADRIDVQPWQDRSAIEELLARSSVFVHPSYVEALSVSLLEAMAAGLCCLATEVGAHGEILDDGENALVVVPGDVTTLADRLAKAVTDEGLRLRLGREAVATIAEHCSTGAVSRDLGAVYERVLTRSG